MVITNDFPPNSPPPPPPPPPQKDLKGISIRKLVCGAGYHWAALSVNGQVYVCGQGEDGQLGLGKGVVGVEKPTLVTSLKQKFVTQVFFFFFFFFFSFLFSFLFSLFFFFL